MKLIQLCVNNSTLASLVLLLSSFSVNGEPLINGLPLPSSGMLLSKAQIKTLPTTGSAWRKLKQYADRPISKPKLSNKDDMTNVQVLAKALVYVRTGENKYRQQVIKSTMLAINTENGGNTLSLARELMAYVVAADLVGMPEQENKIFKAWLATLLNKNLKGRTLRSTHEDRPNNWGTHSGASRIALAWYLGDINEIKDAAQVFKGYLGDTKAYNSFKFGKLHWQSDSSTPVAINPKGAKINGHNVDGVLTDDQRRCCKKFTWPAPYENYVYEGLQGVLAQAMLLDRLGYDVWNWQDKAILRAFNWMYKEAGYPAEKDDTWQPHVINHFYNTSFPVKVPTRPGKAMGYTDWFFGK